MADYRKTQFEQLKPENSEYNTRIKISKTDGSTNWMDITEEELEKIKAILTE